MKTATNIASGVIAFLALACASTGVLADNAGQVQFVMGAAQITSDSGKTRPLAKGDMVSEGDTLTTSSGATVHIQMQDGGVMVVRPDSKLKIENFKFSGQQDGSERNFLTLLRGGLRAITGLIGRDNRENYRVTTPTATIGIRGTDHEIVVVVPGSALAALAPAGTYNKVNKGATAMANDKGTVLISPNQMGYAGEGRAPELQPVNLKLFVVTPGPQAGAGKEGNMRDHAVVDAALLGQEMAPGLTQPGGGMTFIRTPITATYGCLLTGQRIPSTCTATF